MKLQFKAMEIDCFGPDAIQAKRKCANGRFISVVRHKHSYGGRDGLYELCEFYGHRSIERGFLTLPEAKALASLIRAKPSPSKQRRKLKRRKRFLALAKYHVSPAKRKLFVPFVLDNPEARAAVLDILGK